MSTEPVLNIKLDNGKYTVREEANGRFHALRHGEEWRDLTGDNLIYFLAVEVAELHKKVNDAKNCLVCAAITDAAEIVENTLAILDEDMS